MGLFLPLLELCNNMYLSFSLLLTQFQINPLSVLAKGIKLPSDVMENF